MLYEGKIGELKDALMAEFGFGAATIDRLFAVILGTPESQKCMNCGAHMAKYVFTLDGLDVLLLTRMADAVHDSLKKGMAFTEANRVHVQQLSGIEYAAKSRTTQLSKLALIAKYVVDEKQVPGTWVITSRGWDALSGEPVPKKVTTFRGKITERSEEVITLGEASKVFDPAKYKVVAGYSKGTLV